MNKEGESTKKVKSGRYRQAKGCGGLNHLKNGNYEGTLNVKKLNGDSIFKSFTRKTVAEINHIKYQLKSLEPLDNDVLDIKINKKDNEITLIRNFDLAIKKQKINPNILVDDYVDYWLWNHKRRGQKRRKKIKDTTFNDYVQKSKHIKNRLGSIEINGKEYKIKIKELTFEFIEKQLLTLYEETSENTAIQVRNHVYNMLNCAKKDKIIKESPLDNENINFPESKIKHKRKIIEETDIDKVIQYCLDNWYIDVLTQILTGGRASEIRGLIWACISESTNEISFTNNYVTTKQYGLDEKNHIELKGIKSGYTTLKSEASYRTIKVDEFFMRILKKHKELQQEKALKEHVQFKETDPVFTGRWYGKPLGRNTTNDRVKKVMSDLKIKNWEEITSHCLRKSFCSAGILNGVPAEYMAKLMGHSDIKVTLRDIY